MSRFPSTLAWSTDFLVAILVVLVASAYFFCCYYKQRWTVSLQIIDWNATFSPSFHRTFTLTRNISQWGTGPEVDVSHHIPLSKEKCEEKLTKNATSTLMSRRGNAVVRWDTNTLAANTVCEDEMTIDLFSRTHFTSLRPPQAIVSEDADADADADAKSQARAREESYWSIWGRVRSLLLPSTDFASEGRTGGSGSSGEGKPLPQPGDGSDDLMLVTMLDGHGGGQTSALLKRVLNGTLAYAFAGLGLEGWTSRGVYETIVQTFIDLDKAIVSLPLSIIYPPYPTHLPSSPNLPNPNPALLASVPIAGACACTALIDSRSGLLYLANLGDCRAVAGWYNPTLGRWRTDVLSQDHNAANPVEAERVRSEHPTERDTVIINQGYTPRLVGNAQPTRAFGDDNLKTSKADMDEIEKACSVKYTHSKNKATGEMFPKNDGPYMGSEPEVAIRHLRKESEGEELRFLIVATDGLWDKLTSEEAVLLLAAHSAHAHHTPISKSLLPTQFPQTPLTPSPSALAFADGEKHEGEDTRPYPAEPLPGTVPSNSKGVWLFEDDNAATHLMRNGLDGDGDKRVHGMTLSLPGGVARKVRDDTSVV
ncbi:hypothetical protein I317_04716 [Kwoniella heveanensis CBS 569]|nr:hypothetical protein I317_04716 [Kwoniella heveanensis CBS 569]